MGNLRSCPLGSSCLEKPSEPPDPFVCLKYKSEEKLYVSVIIKFSEVIRNFEFMPPDGKIQTP